MAAQVDPDVLEFALITDTHKWGPSADIRYADANIQSFVSYCNSHPNIQFALHTGDFMNAYDTNHEQALFCLEHGRQDFEGLRVPFYVTKGNHDCNGKQRIVLPDGKKVPDNTQIVTDREYSEIFHPLSPSNPLGDKQVVIDEQNPHGNYYYRDFPDHKFRLIVLNDYDLDSLEYYGYHGAQMKWMAEQALDFTQKPQPSEWCFLVIGHGFGFNMFGKPISRLLHAYINGQDFEDHDRGYSYHCQFDKMPRARLVALLGGHNHEDMYDNPDGYNIIHVNRGFATGGEVGVPNEELCFDHFYLNTREKTLYEKRIGRGRSHMFSYDPGRLIDPLPVFPEAMGMGGFTHGGAQGQEVWVTNLNDDGRGSLRWAISQPGNRQVCFKVSGTIRLKSPLVIQHDSISICGHSAPGQGIALQGHSLQINASEVILRYLHLRSCELSDGDFGQKNIILDHLSSSFTEGPAIAIRRAQNVTVQHCLVSHCRNIGIEAGGYMSTYYHNLIANCPSAIHIPDNEGENRWVHIFRNVIDNWSQHAMYGGGCGGEITIEENYLLPGPATSHEMMLDVSTDHTGRYYVSHNTMRGHERSWDEELVCDSPGLPYLPVVTPQIDSLRQHMEQVARPAAGTFTKTSLTIAAFHYRSLFTRPTRHQTWREAMLNAGCSLNRDSYDNTLIASLRNHEVMGGTDHGLYTDVKALGGYPRIPQQSHSPIYTSLDEWLLSRTEAVTDRSIVILFHGDTRGSYDAFPIMAGHQDAIQSDSCHVAIVAMGDFLTMPDAQASALADTTDAHTLRLIQAMQYDAILLGQSELSQPQAKLRTLFEPIQQQLTTGNMLRTAGRQMPGRPYVIQAYGRHRIAYVGVNTPDARLSQRQFVQTVQQSINRARSEGVSYVILLTQLDTQSPVNASELVARLRNVDAVLDTSDGDAVDMQMLSDLDQRSIPLCNAGSDHQYFGKLIIAPDGLITSQLIPVRNLPFRSRRITQITDQF